MLVAALRDPAGMAVVVVVERTSIVPVFVVGMVNVVVEVRMVVLPVSIDVSEIVECLVEVPDGVTAGKEDVASVVCLLA